MSSARRLHLTLLALGLAGIGLFIWLLLRHDITGILSAIAAVRWYLLAIIAFHLIPLLLDTCSWRVLFPKDRRPSIPRLLHLRWIGEAISTLLPATQLGGDVIRARLAASNGDSGNGPPVPLSLSAATVLVDITASILAQTLFTLTGLMLLAVLTGHSNITLPAIAGSLIAILAIGAFYALQRFGIFRLLAGLVARLARSEEWKSLVPRAENLDEQIRTLYGRRAAFAASGTFTMLSWFAGAAEVYIALYALDLAHGASAYPQAVALEAVGQGIRSAMFFIPGAIGIQEAGYLGVGAALGIPAEAALALSLIRRARELAVGIPGLIAWHAAESRRLLKAPVAAPVDQ